MYNKEPVFNWKCIVFTLVLSIGYWVLPKKNKWILLVLLYVPYIVLAYYDHYYKCERNMGPTYLSLFYWWAKPQDSQQVKDYNNWTYSFKHENNFIKGIMWHPERNKKIMPINKKIFKGLFK